MKHYDTKQMLMHLDNPTCELSIILSNTLVLTVYIA